ncbi:phospholipase D-like domain-containing protein [Lyngbya confervoides]|uniref:Phospholipase D-like domain-containing protein n=1 Tax=Lyngbya confervoides BDU141951 TaxID=1574623 RepID=A0ABD4T2J2_9CYAN|nr:phospholipase D-like domain-containing protein [Lyngbya confervoides]MCM1982986.1 phospholipase D-like domain-containing protein [Lyngbya confervoides BDU141951]
MKPLEWSAVGASVVGVGASAATQQFLYAVAPMAVAIALGSRRRHRQERQIQRLLAQTNTLVVASNSLAARLDQAPQPQPGQQDSLVQALDRLTFLEAETEGLRDRLFQMDDAVEWLQSALEDREQSAQLEELRRHQKSMTESLHQLNRDQVELRQENQKQFEDHLQAINVLLRQSLPTTKTELIYDRQASRAALIEALQRAEDRLILVCPWIAKWGFNDELMHLLRQALQRQVRIDVGWRKLSDLRNACPHSGQRWAVKHPSQALTGKFYASLGQLYQLEREFQPLMSLKLLGTHEKYLVCDRRFALLGSHNFLTSGGQSQERELGIWTDDAQLIQTLIDRYESGRDRFQGGYIHLA